MPTKAWWNFPLILSVFIHTAFSLPSFENTVILRTIELGGSVVHVTTSYTIRALEDEQKVFTVVLGRDEKAKTSWVEAKVKGQKEPLELKEHLPEAEKGYELIDITLPKPLGVNKTMNIVLETVQTHVTWPWPETATQTEDQALQYKTNLLVLSPYYTLVQRTKLKAIVPRIISYTVPQGLDVFTDKDSVTKSGATLTYGPYERVPPSTNDEFIEKYQQPFVIHYNHEQPILEVPRFHRFVEVSHWGANLNTEDKVVLHNAGPKLKGHFSRFEYQSQRYFNRLSSHILPALTLYLPPGIRHAYFYDLIGNVSTSSLKVVPSVPRNKRGTSFSILEMRPRYPLLGGWNYSFTLGWDTPLTESASYNRLSGKYIVEIPIMSPLPGAIIDEEELTIILPEGATDVEFVSPFPPVATSIGRHATYLDTTGRPKLTFQYKHLTMKHNECVFVAYKLSWSAHLKKPIAVGIAFLSLFIFCMIARRVNLTINEDKKG